jgi:hypothetical protein
MGSGSVDGEHTVASQTTSSNEEQAGCFEFEAFECFYICCDRPSTTEQQSDDDPKKSSGRRRGGRGRSRTPRVNINASYDERSVTSKGSSRHGSTRDSSNNKELDTIFKAGKAHTNHFSTSKSWSSAGRQSPLTLAFGRNVRGKRVFAGRRNGSGRRRRVYSPQMKYESREENRTLSPVDARDDLFETNCMRHERKSSSSGRDTYVKGSRPPSSIRNSGNSVSRSCSRQKPTETPRSQSLRKKYYPKRNSFVEKSNKMRTIQPIDDEEHIPPLSAFDKKEKKEVGFEKRGRKRFGFRLIR